MQSSGYSHYSRHGGLRDAVMIDGNSLDSPDKDPINDASESGNRICAAYQPSWWHLLVGPDSLKKQIVIAQGELLQHHSCQAALQPDFFNGATRFRNISFSLCSFFKARQLWSPDVFWWTVQSSPPPWENCMFLYPAKSSRAPSVLHTNYLP